MWQAFARHFLKNVISFKSLLYLREIRVIITKEETGSESLSKLPKGKWVVREKERPGFETTTKPRNFRYIT